jgi:hypothetical protein
MQHHNPDNTVRNTVGWILVLVVLAVGGYVVYAKVLRSRYAAIGHVGAAGGNLSVTFELTERPEVEDLRDLVLVIEGDALVAPLELDWAAMARQDQSDTTRPEVEPPLHERIRLVFDGGQVLRPSYEGSTAVEARLVWGGEEVARARGTVTTAYSPNL